ncbi:aldo/keto reductase [Sulfitobacter donghicola]|uniref:Aldo/keto reductase n=1 Tax=Sulfitobacter donghicola DSW-25 = KCTC 12864 = JCM 14565 TaxID=1300350 RepID=A0A073IGQ7_9RHOB|nr:aldo/keto reductase [Sulfitobacter donghicola]KEJ88984.1 aldo/keto reductase [Sulfitobacter donghicola DSW-25 = KCTC 12864 = JCM 14565]KIN67464.1 Oxidoreductase, aldo/keto reductase family [Sulfitobacter donghicola DSW-25 = KCTC 12864 = JCM 14565]
MRQNLTSLDGTPASRLAFGTMQFGGRADFAASQAMFEASLEAGITHFDTAHLYTDGASETFLGQLIKPHREGLIIATKAAYTGGAGAANIRASAETSRKRMGIDVIDALYLHRFDPDTDMHKSFEELAKLKSEGVIRAVGISNFAAWQAVKACFIAAKFDLEISLIQPMYSAVKRQAEVEILPMAKEMGMLCAPYSPLGGGMLTGKYAKGGVGRLTEDDRYAARYRFGYMHEAAAKLSEIAAREGVHPATLAVAWAASHETNPTPIVSARSPAQLAPSLAAMQYTMSPDLYSEIAGLVPPPASATDRAEEQ